MEKNSIRTQFKLNYRKVLEISMLVALFFLIVMFQVFKQFRSSLRLQDKPLFNIELEAPPPTEQIERPPPPPRPTVAIPTEDEDVPEDLTITETEIDFNEEPPPAPPPPNEDQETPMFVPYDSAPEPIGGQAAMQKNLKYPEIARRAGVEGTVIIQVLIDIKGNVKETRIARSLGNNGCDEAAVEAIKKTKWKPALQRDKPVKVWVSIPVIFKLKEGN